RIPRLRPGGGLRNPLAQATSLELALLSRQGELVTYRLTLTNTSAQRFAALPVEVDHHRSLTFVSASLWPTIDRSVTEGRRLVWENANPGLLPALFRNFISAWQAAPFGQYFFNSAVVAVACTLGTLLTSTMAAYAFARVRFRGRELLFTLFLGTLMIPGEITLTPNYIILARLDWLDKYQALIIPWLAGVFGIFLLRQFIRSLPEDLFDAARLDGAGHLTTLWHVVLPLIRPGLFTVALFSFLGSWNSLIWPALMAPSKILTVQTGLNRFVGEVGIEYGELMAASFLVILPILLGFFFVQRQFIEGIARSGLK
ncbi:MAG: carbohydrate ABC transporter permease, partial [Deinococcus sp.]|nr:carbohydrate ABC transporter permease [Deinococcus sp.]